MAANGWNFQAFYEALLEAKGVSLCVGGGKSHRPKVVAA